MFGHFGGVQVRALLFHGAHGVADNDGGRRGRGEVVGDEEVARNEGLVLGWEGHRLEGYQVTSVEVVGAQGEVLRRDAYCM